MNTDTIKRHLLCCGCVVD